jgi:hypothetical protein
MLNTTYVMMQTSQWYNPPVMQQYIFINKKFNWSLSQNQFSPQVSKVFRTDFHDQKLDLLFGIQDLEAQL